MRSLSIIVTINLLTASCVISQNLSSIPHISHYLEISLSMTHQRRAIIAVITTDCDTFERRECVRQSGVSNELDLRSS